MHKVLKGHEIEDGYFHDEGGGLEDFWAWCHTCDPTGENLMTCEIDPLSSRGHILVVGLKIAKHLDISLESLIKELE